MKIQTKPKQVKQTPSKSKTLQTQINSSKAQQQFKSRVTINNLNHNNSNHIKCQLKCGIDSKYLNSFNYLSTCQFAQKRNFLYKLYCAMIRDYYLQFNYLYQKCNQKNTPQLEKNTGKFTFLTQFKAFVHQFISIFKQVSMVQVGYFQNLQDDFARRQNALEWSTSQLIQKLQIYKKSQLEFEQNSKIHNKELHEIYGMYQNMKKEEKDPYSYFNRKLSTKKANQLLESLKKQQTTRQSIRKDLDEVYQNSTQFQSNLILYRQQLFTNKYKIMKKLTQISKNSRNSLMEFLVYLSQCTSRKNQDFTKIVKKIAQSNIRKRSKSFSNTEDKVAVQSFLIQVTNQYNRTIEQIQHTVKNVADIFQELRKFNTNKIDSKKKILELMNTVYDVDQNPDNQVSKTLNFYQDFCIKIFQINNGINIATTQFAKLKKQAKKLAQITLSLMRNSKTSIFQKSLEGPQNETVHHSQIEILLEKLSYDYPINLIQNIYKDFQKTLSSLKNQASQKFHMKKRLMMDSMEISQFEDQTLVQPKKRICKKQIWLWEKWQNQNDFKIDEFKISSLSQIKQITAKIIFQFPDAKQTDRFSCSIQTKGQTAGFLIITDKYLKFQTSQGNCILAILLEQIQDAKIVVKMFGKIVAIATTNGLVCLRGCLDTQKVVQCIEQARTNSGAPFVKPPRNIVEITVEELAFMQQRKNKIKNQLPKLSDYTLQKQILIEDISIDHLYELLYSDKQVNIRGKTQINFFAYTMKKNGSSNYEGTKYDSTGPKFFTHQQGVTFLNCPLFSTRINNYDVKLPPIPFMPKYAHNRQQCKLYWISNEQFWYMIHNDTTGAPKSDTFFIQILHKISKKEQKIVRIQFYWRIVFSVDSFLKTTILSSVAQQVKRKLDSTVADMMKYCQQMTAINNNDNKGSNELLLKQEQTQQEQKRNLSQGKGFVSDLVQKISKMINKILNREQNNENQIKKQKQQSKVKSSNINTNILLVVLTIVLVLNLIVHLFSGNKNNN